ncbi:unnamed protein product, partial [Rotaria sp. Silwood1]
MVEGAEGAEGAH